MKRPQRTRIARDRVASPTRVEHVPLEPLPFHGHYWLRLVGTDLIDALEPSYRESGIAVEPGAPVRRESAGLTSWVSGGARSGGGVCGPRADSIAFPIAHSDQLHASKSYTLAEQQDSARSGRIHILQTCTIVISA